MLKDLSAVELQLLSQTLFPKGLSMPNAAEKLILKADKAIGILVKKAKGESLNDADNLYLHKVFGSKGLNLVQTDYAIVDATNLGATALVRLIKNNQLKIVFAFNINPQILKINTRTPYTPIVTDGITYVFAHSLSIFKETKEHRYAMLNTLQALFSVN